MAFEELKAKRILSPYTAIAVLLVLILGTLPILSQLRPDNTLDVFYPAGSPTIAFEDELRAQFPEDDSLIGIFTGDALYSDETITALSAIGEKLEALNAVDKVLSVTTRDHIQGSFDGFEVIPLLDIDKLEETTASERKASVLSDRFAPGTLVSRNGDSIALVARLHHHYEAEEALEIEKVLRAEVEAYGLSNIFIGTTGSVGIETAFFNSMLRDNTLFVPAALFIGLIILWLMFRRPLALFLGIVSMVVVSMAAMSVVALIGQPLSLSTSMVSPLMIALTIALLVHLYNAVIFVTEEGHDGPGRFAAASDEIRKPARLTALTTAAGFSSLLLSPIPPLQAFGIASAFGVLVLYMVVIHVLPPILARWDQGDWKAPRLGMAWVDVIVRKISQLTLAKPGMIAIVSGLVLLAGLPATMNITVETDNFEMLATDHPLRQTTSYYEENYSGVTTLEVVFDAEGRDSLKAPERLQAIKAFQTWALSQPEIDYASSMPDVIEEMNWAFNEEDPAARALPENERLISQYLFIYGGDDLYDLVEDEFTRTRVSLMSTAHGAREIGITIDKISAYLEAQNLDMNWQVAGFGRLFSDFEWLVIDSQMKSAIAALFIIFIMMAWNWRSLGDAALCMLPNAAPLIFMFIMMGLTGITLNIGTAIISSVAVGVAVDDTIHMFSGMKSRIAKGLSLDKAVEDTFTSSGRAVFATTIILASVFLLLTGSDFMPTSQFGLITGLGLIAALIFDLFLLPSLVILLHRHKTPQDAGLIAQPA